VSGLLEGRDEQGLTTSGEKTGSVLIDSTATLIFVVPRSRPLDLNIYAQGLARERLRVDHTALVAARQSRDLAQGVGDRKRLG